MTSFQQQSGTKDEVQRGRRAQFRFCREFLGVCVLSCSTQNTDISFTGPPQRLLLPMEERFCREFRPLSLYYRHP
jgi:hypothetical protein